ncbi:hypothetical protein [Actinomadura decatromicini]|uniref:Secreted protein n=1 Tax=Actinomadura decatromicini TaxID=2604572 RepID=A0A5D3FWJ7_9ACTN|nr:hypothetical protein [Actinomadura decatromicini]TYK52603.1 hypothetical protein FXF68_02195 [Actinomadura decatromicini]
MNKPVRALIIAVTGVATTLTFATAAHAGRGATSSMTGSRVTFDPNGDKFTVCDTSWDGWDPYVKYEYIRKDGTLQKGEHYVHSGDGTCDTFSHKFTAGRSVQFVACVDIWSNNDMCAREWATGVA